jgi:hypothetical protein
LIIDGDVWNSNRKAKILSGSIEYRTGYAVNDLIDFGAVGIDGKVVAQTLMCHSIMFFMSGFERSNQDLV